MKAIGLKTPQVLQLIFLIHKLIFFMQKLLLSCFLLFCCLLSIGQNDSIKPIKRLLNLNKLTNNNLSLLIVPAFTISPETDFKFGALADYFYNVKGTKGNARLSSTWGQVLYSTNNQLTINLGTNTYTKNESYYINAKIGYIINYERYWGFTDNKIANDDYAEVRYNRSFATASISKNLGKNVFLGINANYSKYYNIAKDRASMANETTATPLTKNSEIFGGGLNIIVDKRDNQFTATKGYYLELSNTVNINANNRKYAFNHLIFDGRKYFSHKKNELALQLYTSIQSGTVPVFEKNRIGGPNQLRGIFNGRFRDDKMWYAQSEYRIPLSLSFKLALFSSVGNTATNFNKMFRQSTNIAGGTGLRFLLIKNKKIYLRADVAYTNIRTFGYYIRIGDAF
jgi:hypothetical protein